MSQSIKRKAKNAKSPRNSASRKIAARRAVVQKTATKEPKKRKPKALTSAQREQLILSHRDNGRKLARSMLRKWRVRLPSDEIDSVVDLTLCEAAARFEPSKGAAFMTFLFYHMRGNLVRTVAAATHASNIFLSYTQEEEGESEDWTFARHDVLRQFIADFLKEQHDEFVSPEDMMIRQETIDVCRAACSQLDELEQTILIRSFQDEESLVDISNSLGYSRCHISRVKQRALDMLRMLLEGKTEEFEQKQHAVLTEIPKRRSRRKTIDEQELSLVEEKLAA